MAKLTKPAPTSRPTVAKKPTPAKAKSPASGSKEGGGPSPAPKEEAPALPPLETDMDWVVSEEIAAKELADGPQAVARDYTLLLSHVRSMFFALPPGKTLGVISRQSPEYPGEDREGPRVQRLRKMVGG